MRIIPVIDLKGGVVVRGMAGRRDEYRPIVSRLCDDPSPASVARGLRETFGFDECYVADLDAIMGRVLPNPTALSEIISAGFHVWLDYGNLFDMRQWCQMLNGPRYHGPQVVATIVGLESLPDDPEAREKIDWEDVVFSLDLNAGKPMTQVGAWSAWSPEKIADHFVVVHRATRMIVLDLAGVGVGQGVPTLDLCRRLRTSHPELQIISGGGVRGLDDLHALRDAGCNAALVASALHDGRLTPEMLKTFSPDERT